MSKALVEWADKPFRIAPRKPELFWTNWRLAWMIAVSMMCSNLSLKQIPLSVYVIILNLKPVLVILISFAYGVESVTCKKAGLILVSFFGAILIINPAAVSWLVQSGLAHFLGVPPTPADTGRGESSTSLTNQTAQGALYYFYCFLAFGCVSLKALSFISIKKSSERLFLNNRRRQNGPLPNYGL